MLYAKICHSSNLENENIDNPELLWHLDILISEDTEERLVSPQIGALQKCR